MTKAFSKLTSKAQTTVPRQVRQALQLKPGDALVYEIDGTRVSLGKLASADVAHLRALQASLSEWETPEDAGAFDDL
jgi:antitoxin PrlF